MKSRTPLFLFALLFPIMLIVGVLISLAYSLRAHENPSIDWMVVIIAAIVLDAAFTWLNRKDLKGEKKDA